MQKMERTTSANANSRTGQTHRKKTLKTPAYAYFTFDLCGKPQTLIGDQKTTILVLTTRRPFAAPLITTQGNSAIFNAWFLTQLTLN